MRWSKYNTLFRFEGYGRFCYNALSNRLIELDEIHYGLLETLQSGHDPSGLQENGFLGLLREKRVLFEAGEEENLLLTRQHLRQAYCFDSSKLKLTICPTLRCNFRCQYCYEASQRDGRFMSKQTQERLIDWIKEHSNIRSLFVAWYGGEPLLAFDTICTLTKRFLDLGLAYDKCAMVTNGYLLDGEKISRLNDLNIDSIQITLDGPPEVHDTRRVLVGGGPTFTRILENITALMDSDYSGECEIRVNVDKSNLESFLGLRSELLARFKGKKLVVYPGRVDVLGNQSYDRGCCLDTGEWATFNLELARRHGMRPTGGLHPVGKLDGACVAGMHEAFVLGPEGELYKCWNDVGQPAMEVGNIHSRDTITNPVLRAQYATGVDPFLDPECRSCAVLPICGGGCANRRLLAKYQGREDVDYCSHYKTRLREYLEAYIDTVRTREMCAALLKPGKPSVEKPGYRVISPAWAQNPPPISEGKE
jgi:uncharacterized protein